MCVFVSAIALRRRRSQSAARAPASITACRYEWQINSSRISCRSCSDLATPGWSRARGRFRISCMLPFEDTGHGLLPSPGTRSAAAAASDRRMAIARCMLARLADSRRPTAATLVQQIERSSQKPYRQDSHYDRDDQVACGSCPTARNRPARAPARTSCKSRRRSGVHHDRLPLLPRSAACRRTLDLSRPRPASALAAATAAYGLASACRATACRRLSASARPELDARRRRVADRTHVSIAAYSAAIRPITHHAEDHAASGRHG